MIVNTVVSPGWSIVSTTVAEKPVAGKPVAVEPVAETPAVEKPVAVRYAWARNPLGNLVNGQHHERILPVPSFRTDDWDWPEAGFGPDARGESGRVRGEMRKQAEEHNRQRRLRAAKLLVEQLQAEK